MSLQATLEPTDDTLRGADAGSSADLISTSAATAANAVNAAARSAPVSVAPRGELSQGVNASANAAAKAPAAVPNPGRVEPALASSASAPAQPPSKQPAAPRSRTTLQPPAIRKGSRWKIAAVALIVVGVALVMRQHRQSAGSNGGLVDPVESHQTIPVPPQDVMASLDPVAHANGQAAKPASMPPAAIAVSQPTVATPLVAAASGARTTANPATSGSRDELSPSPASAVEAEILDRIGKLEHEVAQIAERLTGNSAASAGSGAIATTAPARTAHRAVGPSAAQATHARLAKAGAASALAAAPAADAHLLAVDLWDGKPSVVVSRSTTGANTGAAGASGDSDVRFVSEGERVGQVTVQRADVSSQKAVFGTANGTVVMTREADQ